LTFKEISRSDIHDSGYYFLLGENCPIKQNCYRFTANAKITGRRDCFGQVPYNFITNCCEYFISNPPDKAQISLRAYEIWEQMGYPDGKSEENWLQPEKELINAATSLAIDITLK
jgi:hypothetical protein